jgi:glycosyltransferase involved in cell wall biosynthesis
MSRLLILQPYLTEYRVPFFEHLEAALAETGIELVVGVGQDRSTRGDKGTMRVPTILMPDLIGPHTGDRLRWRRLRLRQVRPDFVITEFAGKNLESWPLLVSGRRRVALWGHVGTPRLGKRSRLLAADWFFAYTEQEAKAAARAGFPSQRITSVHNSNDTAALAAAIQNLPAESVVRFRHAHGLTAGHTALFIGGVDEAKGIGYLLQAAQAAGRLDPAFRWVVAGAGTASAATAAAGVPVVPVGRVTGSDKALVLAASDVIAMPSAIGLVAVDALVAGSPIVTRSASRHGPEISYLHPDRHLVPLSADASPEEFGRAVVDLLQDPRLAQMSAACRAEGHGYGVEQMAGRFSSGVMRWVGV